MPHEYLLGDLWVLTDGRSSRFSLWRYQLRANAAWRGRGQRQRRSPAHAGCRSDLDPRSRAVSVVDSGRCRRADEPLNVGIADYSKRSRSTDDGLGNDVTSGSATWSSCHGDERMARGAAISVPWSQFIGRTAGGHLGRQRVGRRCPQQQTTSWCSTHSEGPHRWCRTANNSDYRRTFPTYHHGAGHAAKIAPTDRFSGPTRVHSPNGLSFGLFTARGWHQQTHRPRYIGNNRPHLALWPNNKLIPYKLKHFPIESFRKTKAIFYVLNYKWENICWTFRGFLQLFSANDFQRIATTVISPLPHK